MMLSFLFLFLSVIWSASCLCPPEENIAPHCICKDLGDGPMMLCQNIMSAEQLIRIVKSTESYPMFALTLMESSLLYIPSTLFKNTKYQKIRFVNTQLMSLSDGDLAFEGLEDRLEEIRATDAHFITQWDWSQLRNHRAIRLIDINLIELHSLEEEFPALESLRSLGISKAEISFIHPTAFSKLKNLNLLDMKDNSISELSRSMFPYPAEQMFIINLSYFDNSNMIALWFPVLISLFGPAVCPCPPEEDIAPHCICKDLGDGPMMLCNNIMSTDELIPIIKSTDSCNMFALTLMDSALPYIPSDLFKGTRYEKIRFVNTQIMSLSDGDLAFVGLEDRLEELRATDAHYITQWDWSQLRNHRRLDLIDINLISMYSLDQEFPALKSLTVLGISKAELSFIHPTAFSKLENLKILDLKDNLITELSRDMLPIPAQQLRTLDFSGNLLSSLPENMFEGMPNLKELELNFNKFKTLNEETFLWPFENLQLLQFKGNEFLCDCRLRWLADANKPMYFQGNCTLPENLKGVSLKYISKKVLFC